MIGLSKRKHFLAYIFILVLFHHCEENEVLPESFYSCDSTNEELFVTHPKAEVYQRMLDENRKAGVVGAVLFVKDKEGLWAGASGQADIASQVDMQTCHPFFIASISKVFTATAVYRYEEQALLAIDDPISDYLDAEVVDKVQNAESATIRHLLSHKSGIKDFYTLQFELDRINKDQDWDKEEVLTYIYGKSAEFSVGETYAYSNTNFLLLSMILENASGKTLEQIYREEIFDPLALRSAYYSEEQPIPDGAVKGYADIYNAGQFVESSFLYEDELGIGGDGGIAINAMDLATFFEKLAKGEIISEASYQQMTTWFDLPEEEIWEEYGQTENGFGIEKFNTKFGYAIGHTGFIDGFTSFAFYFPREDMTYVLLLNSVADVDVPEVIFSEVLEEMFR